MAKKLRFKPTPAGILFLSAIGVLLIAIIILTAVGVSRCKKNRTIDPAAETSAEPTDSLVPEPSLNPVVTPDESPAGSIDPSTTVNPDETPDPNNTANPDTSANPSDTSGPGPIVITTPGQSGQTSASPGTSASPSASGPTVYTQPTSNMKKNAQKGYVTATDVNMRKGPGKGYDLVKSKIQKNTAVTLYVEQDGWWFLKCGDKFGYIKKDYISKGTAPSTPASGEATGKVVSSTIALRKEANSKSECIKEYEKDEQLTIYSYKKDSNGKKWYYVKTSDGKKGYMFAEYVKVTNGKVNEQ